MSLGYIQCIRYVGLYVVWYKGLGALKGCGLGEAYNCIKAYASSPIPTSNNLYFKKICSESTV